MTQNLYQGTELANTLAATTQQQFLLGVAADYNNVIATSFPERAAAIAAEIARSRPALVGLQEAALWATQSPYPSGAWTVSYDFLQILLDALAAHGAHYAPVITRTNFTVAGVGLFSSGLMGVSLTERSALLARTDLPASRLQLSNPQQGGYQAYIPVHTLIGTVQIGSGWLSVDATSHGNTFRFITTHLSAITLTTGVQAQQMQELLAGPAATTLPVVIAGDFNSAPTGSAYTEAAGAGFADAWTVRMATILGIQPSRCCQRSTTPRLVSPRGSTMCLHGDRSRPTTPTWLVPIRRRGRRPASGHRTTRALSHASRSAGRTGTMSKAPADDGMYPCRRAARMSTARHSGRTATD